VRATFWTITRGFFYRECMDDSATFDSDNLVNFLKFTAASVDRAEDQLSGIRPTSSHQETAVNVESALCYLATARQLLQNIVGVYRPHCAHDMNRFTDGRPVTSTPNFCESSQWVHLWYPQPEHQWNRPREVGTLTTRNGTRKQIVVSAPSHLDAYTVAEPERL
jgi:hypothetical protein